MKKSRQSRASSGKGAPRSMVLCEPTGGRGSCSLRLGGVAALVAPLRGPLLLTTPHPAVRGIGALLCCVGVCCGLRCPYASLLAPESNELEAGGDEVTADCWAVVSGSDSIRDAGEAPAASGCFWCELHAAIIAADAGPFPFFLGVTVRLHVPDGTPVLMSRVGWSVDAPDIPDEDLLAGDGDSSEGDAGIVIIGMATAALVGFSGVWRLCGLLKMSAWESSMCSAISAATSRTTACSAGIIVLAKSASSRRRTTSTPSIIHTSNK